MRVYFLFVNIQVQFPRRFPFRQQRTVCSGLSGQEAEIGREYLKWRSANLYSGRFAFIPYQKPLMPGPFKRRLDEMRAKRYRFTRDYRARQSEHSFCMYLHGGGVAFCARSFDFNHYYHDDCPSLCLHAATGLTFALNFKTLDTNRMRYNAFPR